MKAKLIIEGKELDVALSGKEIEIEISLEDLMKIQNSKEAKLNGYEKVLCGKHYVVGACGSVCEMSGFANDPDMDYECANYYSSKEIAENNARADTLMRKLRRFAVECRERDIEWAMYNPESQNHYIYFNHEGKRLALNDNDAYQTLGTIYFDSKKTAELAIKEFKDELIWYFTEYKDSL